MNTKFEVWVLFPIYNSDFPAGFLQLYYFHVGVIVVSSHITPMPHTK